MNTTKTMKINDVEYIRSSDAKVSPTTKQIVVLQRGWIVVGDVSKTESEVTISNCYVIRTWGTSNGLGEIAENGPTSKTKLDKCPAISSHPLCIVLFMNVNEEKWNGY